MRFVAAVSLALLIVATTPLALAADDCQAAGLTCTRVSSKDASNVPPEAHKTYYVYAEGLRCPLNPTCRATPPATAYGLLWEETNGLNGLQRSASVGTQGPKPADAVLLA